jgi:hypothetical protein
VTQAAGKGALRLKPHDDLPAEFPSVLTATSIAMGPFAAWHRCGWATPGPVSTRG